MSTVLAGKVALVTGAAKGIGREIALRLGEAGADVAISYMTSEAAALEANDAISKLGRRSITVAGDVGQEADVERIFSTIESALGGVDILVNNAGIHRGGRVEKLALSDFDAVLNASARGTFLCAARAVPHMKTCGWGRIVQIASPAAVRGFAGDAAYGAAKAAQLGMTRCLAVELAPAGITVNAVLPGYVKTDMTASLSAKSVAAIEASVPMARSGDPAEIADAVAHLASPASAYITGVTLPVDGGITL